MTLFHTPTAFLILGLLYFILPTITWFVLAGHRSLAIKLWCGSGILMGLGVLLIALRGHVPAWATFPLANLLVFAYLMMRIQSLRLDLAVVPWRWEWIAAAALLFVLVLESIRLDLKNLGLVVIYNHSIYTALVYYSSTLAWRLGCHKQSHSALWIAWAYRLMAGVALLNVIAFSLGWAAPLPDVLDSNPARFVMVILGLPSMVITHIAYVGFILERTHRKTIEAEKQYRAIIETTLDGFCICDMKGGFIDANKAYCNMTGYGLDELLTMRLSDIKFDGNALDTQSRIQQTIQMGFNRFESRYQCKNGRLLEVEISTTFQPAGAGQFLVFTHDITKRKRAEEEIKQLAFYDPLTQLPNRRLLLDRLQQAMVNSERDKTRGALLFIDLDNFKTLNDTLGHDKGDLLLQQVASRITAGIRESDTVARFGGDEFVVMLTGLAGDIEEATAQAQKIGCKIIDNLNQTYSMAGYEHYCSASIGITLFDGHGSSINDLLKMADIAMYQAKAEGRNTLRFFDTHRPPPS